MNSSNRDFVLRFSRKAAAQVAVDTFDSVVTDLLFYTVHGEMPALVRSSRKRNPAGNTTENNGAIVLDPDK
ncbi:MAG: hypothetical protein JXA71_11695 [Chitinispirillaceae bacterium]|nr:hypothetical protein [Chitinispirillaceae bacterium]